MDTDTSTPQLAAAFPEVARVGGLLRDHRLHIAVAESCTGGLLGAALTAVTGAADFMVGGVISYTNELKMSLLSVPEEMLEAHGAVSEQVAAAMATGVRLHTGADVGVGITGVAGPGAEGSNKPPGLIYVGVAMLQMPVRIERLEGDHGREGNRAGAVHAALRVVAEMVEAQG
ncbi:MAG TPA: CinA family protein [Candidatus Dormibacteraeota bacterium]|jgi:nicotinamide-nucleotide amidase|nr:CinA family protein [Candidatus Dormibacteraeota bacterium]